MTLQCLQLNGTKMVLAEDTEQVCTATWQGFWLSDLMRMWKDLVQFFSVRVVLARPMVDVLKRRRAEGPGNEVVLYGVPLQYGGRHEEEECSWVDGFNISAEESAISEEVFNEKASVLVVAKTGVRFKKPKMKYVCLERGTHGKEDATVRLFCNEKGVGMQVRVAAWQTFGSS